jgi:hypothetical protein
MGQWLELSRGKKHVERRPIVVKKATGYSPAER